MQLRLNPNLDVEAYARAYAEHKFVQIPDLFDANTAQAVEQMLLTLPWRLVCQDDSRKIILLTSEQLDAMSPQERRKLERGVFERAAQNFGYIYFTYPMIEAALSGWDRGHPIHGVTQLLNSPSVLEFTRRLIGYPGVTKIDAQASYYQRGHFLTVHQDDGDKKERRAAYTIGLSRNWQADWGGLLMFIEGNGDVRRAYLPRFNVLTVFDGMMLHSVSAVAPFAPNRRLSIVGWFRDDPPGR
ncbi:2OG-Fe(II) oxygenase [Terricaulis sp.]|uniref:2OG-Fe(II) oxygenase n=1 Tax=Terricaulis sp. TaxID=2768686 RepID=UPI002AC6DC22|nr:2OG-Fe(II) oxygenase family protein [Terricaulis sp.]MDZ4691617.1 2OG-Fe(II) oxygenase family protein [Terricaulis sp.]